MEVRGMTTSTEWISKLRGPKQWRADDGRRVLAAWKNSGESMAGFADRHGLNAQRLAWWRARLGMAAPAAMTLVPVTVRATPAARPEGPALSLVIGDDMRIDVSDASRVPPLWFAAVVDALSRRSA
jgi:hypothetical protein